MIKNTSTTPNHEWLLGGNPNAILRQESEGQKQLVISSQLPVKCDYNRNEAEAQYTLMGIKVLGKTKGDDIFYDVQLPDGWKKVGTDHSMWSKLIDDKGRTRAMIFYKAAFYDRSTHIDFCKRYQTRSEHFESEKNPAKDFDHARIVNVIDTATDKVIFSGEKHFFDGYDAAYKVAHEWLNQNYPDWENVNAYWN